MPYKRTDNNQDEIVEALLKAGCSVHSTASLGQGFPDLVVGRAEMSFLLEVKNGPAARLTPAEMRFARAWQGHYAIVRTVEQALRAVGLL